MSDYETAFAALVGLGTVAIVITIAIGVLSIVATWIIYQKAHERGWAAIVPFYNDFVLFKIAWGNGWMFLLSVIPGIVMGITSPDLGLSFSSSSAAKAIYSIAGIITLVVMIITFVKLAKVFGKGGGFACGLIFLNTIFLCIMAFSNNIQFVGQPAAADAAAPDAQAGFQSPYGAQTNPVELPKDEPKDDK